MYYIELIERFWTYNEKVHAGSTAVAMYLYLLKIANDQGRYDFKISDVAIAKELNLTRKTVKITKDKLMKLGLIEYKTENGLPCIYKIAVNYTMIPSDHGRAVQCIKEASGYNIDSDKYKKFTESISASTAGEEDQKNDTNKISEKILVNDNSHIPPLTEFVDFAKTLSFYKSDFDNEIVEKYNMWIKNGWKNASAHPIINWKSLLKNSLSFLVAPQDDIFDILKIPDIKRPK